MVDDSVRLLKTIRCSVTAVGAVMLAGLLALMVLARGTGEDITGIVAPALLIMAAAGVVAAVVAVLEKRARRLPDQ